MFSNPFLLSLFFFSFLLLQIAILNTIDFDIAFLKRGRTIDPRLFVLVILSLALLVVGLSHWYFSLNNSDRLLYFFSVLFLANIFITFFLLLKTKSVFNKFILSIIASSILLSLALFYQQSMFKNLITAGALLWISPLFFKYFKIKATYIFIFLILFCLFDVYNVYILSPTILSTYTTTFFNGFIEFGRSALGMGDFFFGFLTIGLLWRERRARRAILLATIISVILFITSLIGFKHDLPFTVFILIPTFLLYFL